MNKHQLTYIDLHPEPVTPEPATIWHVLACVAVFALIGVMLAWRG